MIKDGLTLDGKCSWRDLELDVTDKGRPHRTMTRDLETLRRREKPKNGSDQWKEMELRTIAKSEQDFSIAHRKGG
jgi:hypothetical protein